MMGIKLTPQQFKYLMENCKFSNSISAICNNENSELNYHGKIIEALVDLFHV